MSEGPGPLTAAEQLFQGVVIEVCRDRKVTGEEKRLLQSLAKLLSIPVDRANTVANHIIAGCKAGNLPEFSPTQRQTLFQNVLTTLAADGVIDAQENDAIDQIRQLLGIPVEVPVEKKPVAEKVADDGAPAVGKLEPLKCTRCQAMVPLPKAPFVICPYCSEKVQIPRSYVEAVQSRSVFHQRKAQVDALYKVLGQRPGVVGQTLALFSEFVIIVLVFFLIVFSPLAGWMYFLIYSVVNVICVHWYQVNFFDIVPVQARIFLVAFPYFLAFGIPVLLIHFYRRKVVTLEKLQVALVASPPLIPGGPAGCRQCGAPLEVPPNALGVTCPYCSTENLVGIAAKTLRATHDTSRRVGMDLLKAKKEFDRESWKAFETGIALTLGYILICGIFVMAYQGVKDRPDWPPAYWEALKSREELLREFPAPAKVVLNAWTKIEDPPRNTVPFFVPLKKGEKIEIHWSPFPEKKGPLTNDESLELMRKRVRIVFFLQQSFKHNGSPFALSDQEPLSEDGCSLVASIGGWYRIDVTTPDDGCIWLRPVISGNDGP